MIIGIIAAAGDIESAGGAGGGAQLSSGYHSDFSSSPQATVTYSNVDFGAADAARIIFVAMAGETDDHTSGDPTCTIGGIAATLAVVNRDATYDIGAVWYASVPTGTSGDVVISTFNTNWYTLSAAVYFSTTLNSSTPADTISTMTNTGGTYVLSDSISIPSSGFAIIAGGISDAVVLAASGGWTPDTDNTQTFTHQVIGKFDLSGTTYVGLDWTAAAEYLSAVLVAASWS